MSYKIEDWDQTKYIPPTVNIVTELDMVKYLRDAWINVLKYEPSINSLAVLFAQITLETGPNLKYCKCWNIGNIKSTPNDGRCWTAFKCSEVFNGVEQFFDPPNPICNFRAFKTATEGFIDYINFLSQKKNYANAWQEVINGDPLEYSHQLKLSRYYTANEALYTKGVVSICNQFKAKYSNVHDWETHPSSVNDQPIQPIQPLFSQEEIDHIQGQVALSMNKELDAYFATSRIDDDEGNADTIPTPMTAPTIWNSIKGLFIKK